MADESDKFATLRVAAGALLRDAAGRVLLVKPTYKKGWDLPGGYVEHGESPRATALREVREELGTNLDVSELLVLDRAPRPNVGDKLLIIFRGGQLSNQDVQHFQLGADELSEARFFAVDDLPGLMPDRLARRVAEAARSQAGEHLKHGHVIAEAVRSG